MSAQGLPDIVPGGRLAENVMYFARVLRQAGLPVGPGHVIDALRALDVTGVRRRDDFYWTLHAVFVSRRDQQELFDQAFHVFWRDPKLLEKMLSLMLPTVRANVPPDSDPLARRIADALGQGKPRPEGRPEREELDLDMAMTFTDQEVLRQMDFEDMTATEVAEARRVIATMRLDLKPLISRRHRGDPSGPLVDMRQTLRRALRGGPGIIPLQRARQRTRPPALVLLCDISGSMAGYSRMLIHFAHALTNDRDRVHTFVFGTRLTNITRYLRQKDVDIAVNAVAATVSDWQGGTRIGACLHDFNRYWSRRVLGQGAVVVLVTDGLDRDATGELGHEMTRLHMSCRRLVWLNPLLRYDGFEPRSWGVRTMLPHVDEFRSAHNLKSLADLAELLGRDDAQSAREMQKWRKAA